jgi:putative oxidoreductase
MGQMLAAHHLPSFIAYGVFVGEIIAPLMLIVGYYSRISGLLITINMLIAIFLVHMGELFTLNGQGGWALELQGFYLLMALALVFLGGGKYGRTDTSHQKTPSPHYQDQKNRQNRL